MEQAGLNQQDTEAQRALAEARITALENQIDALSGDGADLQAQLAASALAAQELADAALLPKRRFGRAASRACRCASRPTHRRRGTSDTAAAQALADQQSLEAALAEALAASQTAQDATDTAEARIARLEAELEAARAASATIGQSETDLQERLAAALASERAARADQARSQTDAQTRAALFETARDALSDQERLTLEAQRRVEALNQSVAALRQQLGQLQALLDDAKTRQEASDAQIITLGV